MKAMIFDTPNPVCILHISDPARAHVPACQTNVARTFSENAPIHPAQTYGDDYDLVNNQDWLSSPGGFK